MKRFHQFFYNENYSTFHTYLPVQLDGSCNGFQHLALLSDEVEVFEELNLTEASISENPRDLYSFILNKIKIELNMRLLETTDEAERNCIQRLLHLNLNRSHIKMLIMTKPYNATEFRLTNYLVDSLIYIGYGFLVTKDGVSTINKLNQVKGSPLEIDNEALPQEYQEFTKYIIDTEDSQTSNSNAMKNKLAKSKSAYSSMDNNTEQAKSYYSTTIESEYLVSREDLSYFVKEFNKILFIHYPNIKNLMDYLSNIANIMYDLNLPII